MRGQHVLQRWHVAIGRAGGGDGLRFAARVAGDVLRQLLHDARGVFAEFGGGLREPAVDGAVHEQEAEQEHEDRGRERDEGGAENHARAQARAEGAAALVGVELEDVPEQQHQEHHQQQEDDDDEAGEDEGFAGGDRVEDADVECLQRPQQGEEQKHSEPEQKHGTACGDR